MTQFWSGDDTSGVVVETFDDNTTPYGYSPTLYVRARPYDATFLPSPLNVYIGAHAAGKLWDFHQGFGSGEAATVTDTFASLRPGVLHLVRGVWRSAVALVLEPQLKLIGGAAPSPTNRGDVTVLGIWARVRDGGVNNAGTRDEYLGVAPGGASSNNLTGYAFLHVSRTGQGSWLTLLRIKPSQAIVLLTNRNIETTWPGGFYSGAQEALYGKWGPTKMYLDVTTVAGNPTLSAYIDIHTTGSPVKTLAASAVDSSLDKIDMPGRHGFTLQQFGDNTPGQRLGVIAKSFQIQDITGAPILFFRDEFIRRARFASRQITDDQANVGYSMATKYSGDSQGQDATNAHYNQVLAATGRAGMGVTPPGGQVFGWHISQQTYVSDQHWSALCNFINWPGQDGKLGLVLRFTDTLSTPNHRGDQDSAKRCYAAVITYTASGGTFACELRAYPGGGPHTVIASATPAGLVHGTAFTLDVEVQNTDPPTQRPAVRVIVNGTALTFTALASGVVVDGEWVLDNRSSPPAVFLGSGMGWYFTTPTAQATARATIDNIQAKTLSNIILGGGGGSSDPDDWATVPVATERDGASGTLEVPVTWPVRLIPTWRRTEQRVRSGYNVVRARDKRSRRVWRIVAENVSTADRQTLQAFVADHRGTEVPFFWTPPHPYDSETIVGRFTDPEIMTLRDLDDIEGYEFEVGESFGPDVVTAEWESVNPGFPIEYYNSHYRDDGHFEPVPGETPDAPDTTREFKILLSGSSQLGGSITIQASGTAVAGKHYTLSPSVVTINEGDTEKTVTVTILDPLEWYREKLLILRLTDPSGVAVGEHDEIHVSIYPSDSPPTIDFNVSGQAASGSVDHLYTARVDQSSRSGEQTDVKLRVVASGGLVENTDYIIQPGFIEVGDTNSNQAGSQNPGVLLTAAGHAKSGESIVLHVDHEPSDASERNFWQFTHDWWMETVDYDGGVLLTQRLPFNGEKSTMAAGGGAFLSGAPPNTPGWDYLSQQELSVPSPKVMPDGTVMRGIFQSVWIGDAVNDWYTRESFEGETFSGTLGRGHQFQAFMLWWVYVDTVVGTEDWRNSKFVSLQVRNRAPGDLEMGVTFRRTGTGEDVSKNAYNADSRLYHNGSLVTGAAVSTDTGDWGLWITERMHAGSKWGVEEEAVRGEDGVTRNYTRLWVMMPVVNDSSFWIETNKVHNLNGTAKSGSTSTQLVDTSAAFITAGVGIGDVIRNNTDGCYGHVTSVSSQTTLIHTALREGRDKDWGPTGDSYRIWRNARGTATANNPAGTLLTDSGQDFLGENVTIFGLVVNSTTGASARITDRTTTTLTHDALTGGSRQDWQIGDVYVCHNRSINPNTTWAANAIYRFAAAQGGDARNGQANSSGIVGGSAGLRGTGLLPWGAGYLAKSTEAGVLTSSKPTPYGGPATAGAAAPGRFWDRKGFWWEPRGNATKLGGGQLTWTLTIP